MLQKLKYKKEIHIYFETINIIKLVNTFITSHSYCVYVMRTFKIDLSVIIKYTIQYCQLRS